VADLRKQADMADDTQHKRRYIYGLTDAAGSVRYVGQTGNVRKRLRYHWTYRHKSPRQRTLYDWIAALEAPPGITVLEEVASEDADAAEQKWIDRLSGTSDLLNMTNRPGWNEKGRAAAWAKTRGATRPNVSAAVREAWRTGRMKGRPIPEETRRKISEAQRGRPLTEEHKRALREGWARRREAE